MIACAALVTGVIVVQAAQAVTAPTGFVKVCKAASGTGVTGSFQFNVQGGTNPVTVPVNGCSASIKVSAGQITVTEIEQVDFYTASQLVGILSAYNAGTASGAPGPCAS